MTSLHTGTAASRRTDGAAAQSAGTDLPSPSVDPGAARAAMVAELEARHGLRPGPVRDALLVLPREVLMPQAYVRRSTPDEEQPRWDLLDWSTPTDRPELLELLYGGGSVLVQHDGEPLLGRAGGTRSGASITSMSTVMGLTASLLEELDLRPGQRVLDIGTGAGVTAAVACEICGDQGVVTLDRDRHLTDAAAIRLSDLGFRPQTVCGPGDQGVPKREFDRIFVSYATERVPMALVEQLAPGGRLLVHVTSASPSWPALAVVERTSDGRISAELRAVEFAHRAGYGMNRIRLSGEFRRRITTDPGSWTQRSMLAPPLDTDRGLWLAADHLLGGGLVRDSGAEHLVIGAPHCGSWLRVEPAGRRRWDVTVRGPRDIWREIQGVASRWRAAGSPSRYRLHIDPDGGQRVSSAWGSLSWPLPDFRPADEGTAT
ncbi:protein-L-isoaspartate O-methyltransferase [Streptomyces sp. B29(2018)]|uniref:protein-L-isoaspartate O-methyltransferase family protein n=1 Tax=Streptomyces sp. B29(2018) TaxID=2485016 RepID=UPI000FD65B86|nr:methyltransferase [Streptomyces sp. B29(2018)]